MATATPATSTSQRHTALLTYLRNQANAAHTGYPQYAGYFDTWVPVQVTKAVRCKGGSLPVTLSFADPNPQQVEGEDGWLIRVYNPTNDHCVLASPAVVKFL